MAGMPRASNLRHVDKQGHCANKYDAALRRPLVRMPHVLSSRLGLFGEKARQPAAHRVGFFHGPFAKTLAGFHAELAGLDLVAQERVRPRGAVKVVIGHLRDVELRSRPTKSACSMGPSTAVRAPNPSRTTVSIVWASQTPAATSAIASRFIAC